MTIKAVLFDLDGTLLPMEQEIFTKSYFKGLSAAVCPLGYEPKSLIDAIWQGTGAMIKNDGIAKNEEVFWKAFSAIFGERVYSDLKHFDNFYKTGFDKIKGAVGFSENAKRIIELVKSLSLTPILATNPIFPRTAQEKRAKWAGVEPNDFAYITTYENSSYCKPNPKYYEEILSITGFKPEECLMVGNDTSDDLPAETIGIKTFILTDCLINKNNIDLSSVPHGGFSELEEFIKEHS
ncbi:MAG: HAD family hydrolase [Clostridia bacterium]|nr:HAD family hydrolase [Clostridia bacterium]